MADGQAGPCMASVHGIFGWVSWAVHGAWYMASVHGGACSAVHGWCARWGLGKSMCTLPGWKKCMYVLPGSGEAGIGVGIWGPFPYPRCDLMSFRDSLGGRGRAGGEIVYDPGPGMLQTLSALDYFLSLSCSGVL